MVLHSEVGYEPYSSFAFTLLKQICNDVGRALDPTLGSGSFAEIFESNLNYEVKVF